MLTLATLCYRNLSRNCLSGFIPAEFGNLRSVMEMLVDGAYNFVSDELFKIIIKLSVDADFYFTPNTFFGNFVILFLIFYMQRSFEQSIFRLNS